MLNLRKEICFDRNVKFLCKIIFFYIDNSIVKGKLFEIWFYISLCVRIFFYYFMLLFLDRVNIKIYVFFFVYKYLWIVKLLIYSCC